jgi:hypothetical protein
MATPPPLPHPSVIAMQEREQERLRRKEEVSHQRICTMHRAGNCFHRALLPFGFSFLKPFQLKQQRQAAEVARAAAAAAAAAEQEAAAEEARRAQSEVLRQQRLQLQQVTQKTLR